MKILQPHEVNTNYTVNRRIQSGQLGVIINENDDYELVYFTFCHYMSSNGRLSNTFEYRSFNGGILIDKIKSYLYQNIYGLSEDYNDRYRTEIHLIES